MLVASDSSERDGIGSGWWKLQSILYHALLAFVQLPLDTMDDGHHTHLAYAY